MYVAVTVSGFRINWVSAFSPVTFTCPYIVLYLNTILDGIFCFLPNINKVFSVERLHSMEYREPCKINLCVEYREVSKVRL